MFSVWIAETRYQDPWFLRDKVLSESERERCDSLRRKELRAAYILAHALKRLCLAEWLDVPPGSLWFKKRPSGKPAIVGVPLDFNLTHSASACAVMISASGPCGIDLEPRRTISALSLLMERSMSPLERQVIGQSGEPNLAFIERWVVKEAYSKMTGQGLGERFEEICTEQEVCWQGPEIGRLRDMLIWRRDLGGHVVAACTQFTESAGNDVAVLASEAGFQGLTARRYDFRTDVVPPARRPLERAT